MQKYLLQAACFITIVLLASSCGTNTLKGEGKKTEVTPAVATFNAISIEVSLQSVIDVREGAQPAVQLSGYENVLAHIKTKVENNTLRIYTDLDDSWTMDSEDINARITVPSLTALTLQGAPGADIHGAVTSSDFKLDISGAAHVNIDNIVVDNFHSTVSGAADITVKAGTVKKAEYEISGAGKIKAYPLQAAELTASISGAGTSEVTASQKLTASISGAGSIRYKGHPVISKEVSGVGSIDDAN